MVVDVGLQRISSRPRVRINYRIKAARYDPMLPLARSTSDRPSKESVDDLIFSPIIISSIAWPYSSRDVPKSAVKSAHTDPVTQKPKRMKLLERILHGERAFWVVPNRLAFGAAVKRDTIPSSLLQAKLGAIVRIVTPKSQNERVRCRGTVRIMDFVIEPRHNSKARILYDLTSQIVKLMEDEVVLIECPNEEGWDIAVSVLILAGSICIPVSEAVLRLRLLCNAIGKRWTMGAHMESVLYQLQRISHSVVTTFGNDAQEPQLSLGSPVKRNATSRSQRPKLAALRPQSTRIIFAKPFNLVEVRRLIASKNNTIQN